MNSKKQNICLLLPDLFDPNMPARPAITEIHGKYLPSFGHKITRIMPSLGNGKEVQGGSFKEVHIFLTIPHLLASSLPLKLFNLISIFKKTLYEKNRIVTK